MRIINCIELIVYKCYTDIKAESSRSYLGLVWWVVEPIMYLLAFYLLFVVILQRGGPGFVESFLCGAVVWKWFDSGVKAGSMSISTHQGLLQQVYIPKFIFPIIAVMGSTARFVPVFIVLCIFLMFMGYSPNHYWLAIPALMIVQFLFVLSIAMIVAMITPFVPDVKVIIDNGMMLLFFISGIFFSIDDVHEPIRSYLLWNPMAFLIDEYRSILLGASWPDWAHLAMIMLLSSLIGVGGLYLLNKLDHKFGKVKF